MDRSKVYKAFDTERDFQDQETQNPNRPDMIEVNLDKAKAEWYKDNPEENYQNTMEYLKKVGGIIIKLSEKYGIPKRNNS